MKASNELTPDLGERERAYVFAIAMKDVKDEDAAADVTQEAMLLAHRHRASFRGASKYSTWLYRVAATTALMHLRKKRRRSREVLVPLRFGDESSEAILFDPVEPSASPEQHLMAKEAVEVACRRLDAMGEKYRDIFWMRYRDGYTESEIAKRLSLKLTTVKTRAYRARIAMRDTLASIH
jgi:RNA polymerase sigma-70 factor (ECF subfamily)